MKKYLLHTDGSIKNRDDVLDNISRDEVKDIKNSLSNSIYSNKRDNTSLSLSSYLKSDYEDISDIIDEDVLRDVSENFYQKRVKLEKISSFDFVSDDNSDSIYSFKPFNTSSETFAKEFEMLTGWSPSNSNTFEDFRLLPLFTFFNDAFKYIVFIEILTEINRVILGNDNIVENYSFRYGSYTIKGIDIYTKFLFEKLNYPKEKLSIDERIASFVIGFLVWIKPDRLIDIDQLVKEISGNASTEVGSLLELSSMSSDGKTGILYNNLFSTLIVPVIFYIVESYLTINGSLEKRVKLLFNKFSMEKIWNKNLYNAKSNEKENDEVSNFFREIDYYYVKFYIERMHVGSKIFRNVLQKASYLPLFTKESPSTRVAGGRFYQTTELKIESEDGGKYSWNSKDTKQQKYKHEQTTRIRSLPQGLLINDRLLNNIFSTTNPVVKGGAPLVNIGKDLIQNFYKHKDSEGNRLPGTLVKKIEEHLESEYMPFYFHDIRTNEIISFHAFLDSYSDKFNPQYSTETGIGRVEGAKIYKSTSRSIGLSFTLAATSKKDHDLMWYQINKLVSMCYPQFSKGIRAKKLNTENKFVDAEFSYPFTQIPTASPLIRLRVGDILKSNYSPRNLARLHEIDFKKNIPEADATQPTASNGIEIIPAILQDSNEDLDENYILLPGLYRDNANLFNFIDFSFDIEQGYANIKRPVKVKIDTKSNPSLGINQTLDVTIDDPESNFNTKKLSVDSRSVIEYFPLKKHKVDSTGKSIEQMTINQDQAIDIVSSTKIDDSGITKINNPITKAYESGMSRGMAGVIESFSVSAMNAMPWEVSEIGSRGPMSVKIDVSFSPIHDITPGLDHTGMMRAPAYNMGKINNEIFGDVYDNLREKNITSGSEFTKSNVLKINNKK
jgi:hypothetical protein